MKIKDIGEFGLIDAISRKPNREDVLIGIGDDAAVIRSSGLQVLTTDCLVEGDHFRREWFAPQQIGKKAIESNVSDVGAMGAEPAFVLVSLALPSECDVSFVEQMYTGMWSACDSYGIDIIGGNMTHAKQVIISITMLGSVNKTNLCLRSDAKPNDFIMISGPIGYGRAGLRLFQQKIKGFDSVKQVYLEPKAQLHHALSVAPYVNAMIDVSDGLGPEIKHICDESHCGAVVYKEKIPITNEIHRAAESVGDDAYEYALYGGEDFQLVYTVSQKQLHTVHGICIGNMTKEKDITLVSKDKKEEIRNCGYDHFLHNISD